MRMGSRRMRPMCEVVVRPSGSMRETRWVLLVALLTVAVCSGAIIVRNTSARAVETPSWQVDAFLDLRAEELATFNALHTAAPEIVLFHDDILDQWPTVAELEGEFMPPFVQDAAWKQNGGHGWERSVISTQEKHIACYIGRPLDETVSRTFLLVMLHEHIKKEGTGGSTHAPYEIWIHPSQAAATPEMVTDQALINAGWREVVARSGEREMQRTKGEEFLQ